MTEAEIEEALLLLAQERGRQASFCPSEVARQLDSEFWRDLMPAVRRAAEKLRQAGQLKVTRRGEPVPADAPGGPIRLSLA